MKIVLLSHVKGLGQKGEIKEVSEGYFRNMLAPRKLAVLAKEGAVAHIQNQQTKAVEKLATIKESADFIKAKMEGKTLNIQEKVSPAGKLYAAVSPKEILAALREQMGVDLPEKAIQLDSHIKEVGEFKILIKLHPEVTTELKLHVTAQ